MTFRKIFSSFCKFLVYTALILNSILNGSICSSDDQAIKNITIGASFPISGADTTWGDCLMAARFALDQIKDQNLLSGYRLNMEWGNTKCDAGTGMKVLFDLIHNPPQKLMILGSACSPVTEPMAQTSREFKLLQISYISASPALNNRETYPYFFRARASESKRILPSFEIFKRFNWTKIAIITETINLYTLVANEVVKVANETKTEIVTSTSFDTEEDPQKAIAKIKESQVRIIYAGFYPKPGRRVLCRAYHEGLRPPQYVWIGPGWFPGPYWWRNREDGDLIVGNITCNNTVMDFMAEGYFSTDPPLTWDGNKTTVSNMTSEEWIKAYNTYRKYDLYAKYAGGYNFAGYVYDATWAVALTLNNSIQRLAKKKLTLEGFTYGNVDYLEVFTSEMAKLQFLGVTGPLSFTKTGDRVGITVIRRVQNHSHIVIAKYIDQSAKVIWDDSINYIWGTPGNKTPIDFPRTVTKMITVPISLFVIMVIASGFGIVLAIILLRFNVSYREDRAIKITSPNINIAIICGVILCYISVPFLGLDSNILGISTYGMYAHSLVCRIRIWLLLLGFMMGFSALFTKTWRLYVIFTNKTSRKQGMKDKQLSRFIIIAVLVGIIILTAQAIVDPINLQNMILNTKTEENGDLKIVYSITTCVTKHPAIWQSLMLGSNGILLLYGLALAWKTRNIACDVANDSKTIGLAVYNVCVFSSTAALIGFTVTQPAVRFSMIALFILLSTTGSICLIFLPKVWMIKDLARVNSTQRSNEADSEPGKLIERHLHHSASRSSIMPDPKVYKLQDEISELKSLLAKKCQRIEELEKSLLKSKISTITNNEDTIPRLHPELAEDASNSCRCKSANCWKSYFNQDSQEISSYNNSYLSVQSPQQRRVSFLPKD